MSEIPSPCVRNCCLDQVDICLGCGRHVDEIVAWSNADTATRKEILQRASQRKADRLDDQRSVLR